MKKIFKLILVMFLIVSCSQNEEKNQSEQKIINKQIENDSEPSRVDNYF